MANSFGYEPVAGAPHGFEPVEIESSSHGFEPVGEQVNLLSSEGISSLGKTIVPSLKQGVLGLKLMRQEHPEED